MYHNPYASDFDLKIRVFNNLKSFSKWNPGTFKYKETIPERKKFGTVGSFVKFMKSKGKNIGQQTIDELDELLFEQNDDIMEIKKVSRPQINEVVSLIKEAEKLTGKKVSFKNMIKENEETEKLSNITLCVKNIKNVLAKYKDYFLDYEMGNAMKIIVSNLNDIQTCCKEILHKDVGLTEDVDMDIDQITTEPEVVKKLNDKKININLVDQNDRNSASSNSSSTTTTY